MPSYCENPITFWRYFKLVITNTMVLPSSCYYEYTVQYIIFKIMIA